MSIKFKETLHGGSSSDEDRRGIAHNHHSESTTGVDLDSGSPFVKHHDGSWIAYIYMYIRTVDASYIDTYIYIYM